MVVVAGALELWATSQVADDLGVKPGTVRAIAIGPNWPRQLFRSFGRQVGHPAVRWAGIGHVTYHGLRHSFVAILVAAGCNVRQVSEWAGHNSVAFTLTRYGGVFESGADQAVDRLDDLLGQWPEDVRGLGTGES